MTIVSGWKGRLRTLVSNMARSNRHVEYPFKRVQELVDAPNSSALNEELTRLVGSGQLKAFYRIKSSETGAGLAEYKSIIEIPPKLYDQTSDKYQNVVLGRDVELIYRAPE
jgi:hypothetical protein